MGSTGVSPGDPSTPPHPVCRLLATVALQRKDTRPRIDMARRQANRQLATDQLLDLLRSEAPRFYELAEVVGKWVWVQFPDKQPATITSQLAEFGFHWNNKRQVWQHPCGPVTVEGSPPVIPAPSMAAVTPPTCKPPDSFLAHPLRLDRGEGRVRCRFSIHHFTP